MTKKALNTWVQNEIKDLSKEIKAIKPSCLNENLRNYLVSRKSTLKEVELLLKKKSPLN